MLYKFKSDAGGDVIMLEATGRQILTLLGRGDDAKGILLPEQLPAAKAALEAAIAYDEKTSATAEGAAERQSDQANKSISLRTRAWPLVMLIERSANAKVPITWGV